MPGQETPTQKDKHEDERNLSPRLGSDGPEAAGVDAELRLGLGGEVFKKWAERDPAAAKALLETRLADPDKIGSTEQELSKHLMRAWIKNEPDAAMAWLLKQPKAIEEAISPAFQALSHHNPDKALQLVAEQADRPGRDSARNPCGKLWLRGITSRCRKRCAGWKRPLA